MLFDNRDTIRKLAWLRVISARKENQNSLSIRNVRVPVINMQTTDYTDLVLKGISDK